MEIERYMGERRGKQNWQWERSKGKNNGRHQSNWKWKQNTFSFVLLLRNYSPKYLSHTWKHKHLKYALLLFNKYVKGMLFLMSRYLRTRVADFSHKNKFLYFFIGGEKMKLCFYGCCKVFFWDLGMSCRMKMSERKRNHCNWLVIIFTGGGILEAAEHGLFWLKLPG